MSTPHVAGIIPARYGSSRLPGKPLALIAGKTMVQRVYERCTESPLLQSVCVATDDERVRDAVLDFGGQAMMTRADHPSGTDRVAEVAAALGADIVVNIQGDQPFMHPDMLDEAVRPLLEDASVEIATLMFRIVREEDLANPAVVKVVADLNGNALYFSRSLIPYPRENVEHGVFEHVGVYAYRKETLMRLTKLPPTTLERVESLEQLRWLEHGLRIRIVESVIPDRDHHGFSVDTPADLARAEQMYFEKGGK
jgi:3-deoxy-manno-octulosonate cytidylyltransferase (CMP-KDO synthetase)